MVVRWLTGQDFPFEKEILFDLFSIIYSVDRAHSGHFIILQHVRGMKIKKGKQHLFLKIINPGPGCEQNPLCQNHVCRLLSYECFHCSHRNSFFYFYFSVNSISCLYDGKKMIYMI